MRTFALDTKNYPEEYILFKNHEQEIVDYCRENIHGNWMLGFILWGETEETAKPTIQLIYEGTKSSTWTDPVVEGLNFIAVEDTFWGAMSKHNR